MFGWLRSRVECPVDPPIMEWIERRMLWLTEQFGWDRLCSVPVILPEPEYFPDPFHGTPEDARRLLDRVCGYMGVDPDAVELHFYQDRNPVQGTHGQLGSAGLYEGAQGRHRVGIEVANLNDPLAMVGTMAHELSHVLLLGQGRISPEEEDHERLTDLLTVFLGMGVFTANSVIREHYWHAGEIYGWRIERRGYLTMPMYGYALALFARARGEERPSWVKYLRRDVRSAFKKAVRFFEEGGQPNPVFVPPAPFNEPPRDWDDPEIVEEPAERVSLSAEELLKRYACGDRDFRNADLREIRLCGVDLHGSNLSGADLCGADLTNAMLADTDLHEADLRRTVLEGAILRGSNLNGADLGGANLARANLEGADIRGADFVGASLRQAILVGTKRNSRTDLAGVDLREVVCEVNLSKENLQGTLRSEALITWYERLRWWVSLILACTLAGLVGGLLGLLGGAIAGGVLGDRSLPDRGAYAGAVLCGCLAFGILVWRRKKDSEEMPD
jgi:hypothetical protein